MEAYCVKCKTKREIKEPQAVFTSGGTPATRGVCPVCGTTLFRMGRTQAHEGLTPPEKPVKKTKRSGKLVIVESPAKARTVGRFLGKGYTVKASVGHVRDLLRSQLSVDVENDFEPKYRVPNEKRPLVKEIKSLAQKAEEVYLATDPDREGEAIAWHLLESAEIDPDLTRRVVFHEITKPAVAEAFAHPRGINMDLVDAQQARRVLDRLVGYNLSPLLWRKVRSRLSAGRVQSVALRLIIEREREIEEFVPTEYWSIAAELQPEGSQDTFIAKLFRLDGEEPILDSEQTVTPVVTDMESAAYEISKIKRGERKRNPSAPYTTSTLQQEASRRLGFTAKRTMALAQQLYEGIDIGNGGEVGLITYMRTDSTRLAESAVEEARQYIAEGYGLEYVPPKPRFYKNKKSAQDAHEAIRPTSMKRPPKKVAGYLTPQQRKLYSLIWNRFVACQMVPAKLLQTSLDIQGGEYLFRTTMTEIKFRGYMVVYDVEKENENSQTIPKELKKDDPVSLVELDPQQHFTKPPARYTESSLVKELDSRGIGRPSTYALIISTLLDRKYMAREGRSLYASELGMAVNKILTGQFPNIFNVDFTARMEEELDQIETGEKERLQVLEDFYHPFSDAIERAMEKKEEIKESLQEGVQETCPKCGKDLVIKWGRNGRFIACTGYPDCRYTQPLEENVTETDEKCDVCGSPMVVKTGRFGRFLACSEYPECKFTKPLSTGIPCPEKDCPGYIVERKSRRGKLFYGCSNYPSCNFATWYRPVAMACKACGYSFMEERSSKAKGQYLRCPNCKNEVVLEDNSAEND